MFATVLRAATRTTGASVPRRCWPRAGRTMAMGVSARAEWLRAHEVSLHGAVGTAAAARFSSAGGGSNSAPNASAQVSVEPAVAEDATAPVPVPHSSSISHMPVGTMGSIDRKLQPTLVFEEAWNRIVDEIGWTRMVFPKEIIWLAGAPGAGKGTNSSHIMQLRGITAPTIETSSLFNTPEMQRMKDAGILIGDREVVEAVLRALLDPRNSTGVIVDGFPRTFVQAECIKLLHKKMIELRDKSMHDPNLRAIMRRPVFHITVLYVDEEESIRRQMNRAQKMHRENQLVKDLGVGHVQEARATDVSAALARQRYRVFKEEVVEALHSIKGSFHFHLIAANGTPREVKQAIEAEFAYQSSLELGDDTFEMIRGVNTASEIVRHARQLLIQRLNSYAREHPALFARVVALLKEDFMHIVQRQALAGCAVVRSNSDVFDDPVAVNIALDILSERGYWVTLDVVRFQVPQRMVPCDGEREGEFVVETRVQKSYVFKIEFKRPRIRSHE